MLDLESLVRRDLIFTGLQGTDTESVLRELAILVVDAGALDDVDRLHERLMEREELGSTAIGDGVAVPHCKLSGLSEVLMAVATAERGVAFDAVDGEPVRVFFLVVSPEKSPATHLQCLASISRWVKSDANLQRLRAADEPTGIYEVLTGSTTAARSEVDPGPAP